MSSAKGARWRRVRKRIARRFAEYPLGKVAGAFLVTEGVLVEKRRQSGREAICGEALASCMNSLAWLRNNVQKNKVKTLQSIELFSGAGGPALGLHAARFRPQAEYGSDGAPHAVENFRYDSIRKYRALTPVPKTGIIVFLPIRN